MENQQLIDYIKQSAQQGVSEEQIRQSLLDSGWNKEQIDEGFHSIGKQITTSIFNTVNGLLTKIFIIVFVLIILLIIVGGYFFTKQSKLETNNNVNTNTGDGTASIETPQSNVVEEVSTPSVVTTDYLWSVFDQLNNKLKIADYNDYVASESPSSNLMSPADFAELAAYEYNENMKLNKADFVNKWQDDKQAIFSTNLIEIDGSPFTQIKIYFFKNNGIWELLAIDYTGNDEPEPDSDQDGLTDRDETCSGWQESNPNCIKTDPNKRDTNGNGWWDGVEEAM
jgi:hypothetical protein